MKIIGSVKDCFIFLRNYIFIYKLIPFQRYSKKINLLILNTGTLLSKKTFISDDFLFD